MHKSKNRDFLKRTLVEIPSIVIAVLLALALDSYKEALNKEHRTEILKEGILDEIRKNYSVVAGMSDLSQNLIDTLRKDQAAYKAGTLQQIRLVEITPTISGHVWKSAGQMDAFNELDAAFVGQVANLYTHQERVERLLDGLEDFMIEGVTNMDEMQKAAYYANYLQRIKLYYTRMTKNHRRFLQQYDPVFLDSVDKN